jgi:hypothetical protein
MGVALAQWIARWICNRQIQGTNPAVDIVDYDGSWTLAWGSKLQAENVGVC